MMSVTVSSERMVRMAAVRYGHTFQREEGNMLILIFKFEVIGWGKRGRPKATWKKTSSSLNRRSWFKKRRRL